MTKIEKPRRMKCPGCGDMIEYVDVCLGAQQEGALDGRTIVSYSGTVLAGQIEYFCPHCGSSLTAYVADNGFGLDRRLTYGGMKRLLEGAWMMTRHMRSMLDKSRRPIALVHPEQCESDGVRMAMELRWTDGAITTRREAHVTLPWALIRSGRALIPNDFYKAGWVDP